LHGLEENARGLVEIHEGGFLQSDPAKLAGFLVQHDGIPFPAAAGIIQKEKVGLAVEFRGMDAILHQHEPDVADTADQRAAIRRVDQIRSIRPVVVRCELRDGVIAFDRETSFQEGAPRQHIFGAIRFLDGPTSSVQLVAGAPVPRAGVIDEIVALVRSVAVRR
jgi:hypothetical protein